MNTLENYIVKVHSVKPYEAEWTKEFPGKEFVEVDMTSTCYGNEQRSKHVWNTKSWEEVKNQGFYWA